MLKISGMYCVQCEYRITKALKNIQGVACTIYRIFEQVCTLTACTAGNGLRSVVSNRCFFMAAKIFRIAAEKVCENIRQSFDKSKDTFCDRTAERHYALQTVTSNVGGQCFCLRWVLCR